MIPPVAVWWVSGPRWTFGLLERRGVVIAAAPISEWALGKRVGPVLAWWRQKGADRIECMFPEKGGTCGDGL